MSAATSASTGRRYGIQRVLSRVGAHAFGPLRRGGLARSARSEVSARGAAGRMPACSDQQLLAPFAPTSLGRRSRARAIGRCTRGCGYSGRDPRRPLPGAARDARARAPFAPSRAPGRSEFVLHAGTASPRHRKSCHDLTACGCLRWTTAVWTFAAVDSLERGMRGVRRVQSRQPLHAALEPIAQGLRQMHGSVEADVARGLAHADGPKRESVPVGPLFLQSDRWGIRPSFGFVEEPETNGVA